MKILLIFFLIFGLGCGATPSQTNKDSKLVESAPAETETPNAVEESKPDLSTKPVEWPDTIFVSANLPGPSAKQKTNRPLKIVKKNKVDPVRDNPHIGKRSIIDRGTLMVDRQQRLGSDFDPARAQEAWYSEVRSRLPVDASEMVDRFIVAFPEEPSLLRQSEERFGALRSIEKFPDANGAVYVGVYFRTRPNSTPVSIFNKVHDYTVVLYRAKGDETEIQNVFSLQGVVDGVNEIDDIQWYEGNLYFNSTYPSYAKEVAGDTAHLIAMDGQTGELLWRTPALVSRNQFVVENQVVVTGYGFTAEKDYVYLIDRATGAVAQKLLIPSGHSTMLKVGDLISLHCYNYDITLEFSEK